MTFGVLNFFALAYYFFFIERDARKLSGACWCKTSITMIIVGLIMT